MSKNEFGDWVDDSTENLDNEDKPRKRFVTPTDVSEWFKTDIPDFGDFWNKKCKT